MSHTRLRRAPLAACAALFLVAATTATASADAPGQGQGKGKGGSSHAAGSTAHTAAPGKGTGTGKGPGKGHGTNHAGGNGNSHAGGNGHAGTNHAGGNGTNHAGGNGNSHEGSNHAGGNGNGQSGADHAGGNGNGNGNGGGNGGNGGHGSPPGNNGTVKIAPLGELDGIPQNSPHPGCTFQVEWYGFDEGADIISTVSFAMQAPTKDVGLSVAGDPTVFVGGDPATGAGTPTGLDGTQTYTLSFDGAPHPKQGYHVRLTVATPRSNGNDTKSKVFWVEPCTSTPSDEGTETPGETTETPGTSVGPDDDTAVLGEEASAPGADDDTTVLGEQATAEDDAASSDSAAAGAAAGDSAGAAVPTAVDAGEDGRSVADWVRSPLPLLVVGLGLLLAAGGYLTRRSRVRSDQS